MNRFQKLAVRMTKNDIEKLGKIIVFRECKNGWLKKFKDGKFTYYNALQYKNDFIKWDNLNHEIQEWMKSSNERNTIINI